MDGEFSTEPASSPEGVDASSDEGNPEEREAGIPS